MKDLSFIVDRIEELSEKLASPAVLSDSDLLTEVMKEYKKLEPIANKITELKNAEQSLKEAEEIIATEKDGELLLLAQEEKQTALSRIKSVNSEIEAMLLQEDSSDNRNVIVEIRGGAGGEEAALFAHSVYRMYSMYAAKKGWKVETLYINETELGGIKEASFTVEGSGAYSRFKYESGVHRVQRVPETESSGRIHTSTITVAVLMEMEDVSVEISPNDLQIDTFRSSGAGGQHINKTESAIRITHKPTGIVVECQDERSQHKNKDKAMKVLKAKLYDLEQQKQKDAVAGDRKNQVGTGDRSERIRTYNFPQGRVTDHRIGLTVYKIDAFLDGDMDMIIDGLIEAENAEKLKNSES